MMKRITLIILLAASLAAISCRGDEPIPPPGWEEVQKQKTLKYPGLFLLNEGNMGTDKCSLDFLDFESGVYQKNIFPSRNPELARSLGDSGNDLQVYGGRLYAVVNGSNLVEVMNVTNAVHIATVTVPNCRYIAFQGGYAYVTSYADAGADIASNLGSVYKIDTVSCKVVATCTVGYQPEEMAVYGNKLYVANSGGYRYESGDYDRRVSVIDLTQFKETAKIDVAPNLHRMMADRLGHIWVSSRGNYSDCPSNLSVIDASTDKVIESLPVSTTGMAMCGDSLFVYGSEWKSSEMAYTTSYCVIDIKTRKVLSDKVIRDDTGSDIISIYGIAVNPETRDLFITDAKDYITPGEVFCYTCDGKRKWSATTGDIPSRIAFSPSKLK